MCQGLGPKKHNEISEIDRTYVYLTMRPSLATPTNNNNNSSTNNTNNTNNSTNNNNTTK